MNTEDLKLEIEKTKQEAKKYYNYEQAVKLMLNSIYGAFGNQYFRFFNINIAESITTQGKNAILYTEKRINEYFKYDWINDTNVHQKMDIHVTGSIKEPVSIYIDTDSIYMKFEEVIKKQEGWKGSQKEFILKLYEFKLKDYLKEILDKYANELNAENFLNFELESIANNAVWIAKKKYMQNIVWKDPNIHYKNLSKISVKGFEIIQSSTPLFARTKLEGLITYILDYSKDLNIRDFANKLKLIKEEFKLQNIDNISFSKKMNNYQNYILDDLGVFEYKKGTPVGVRAAGYHNYLLNNSNYKGKYNRLRNGEKMKFYYSTDKNCDVFSFSPGDHPKEFAPPVDYDVQFEKTILDPINRVLVVMGYKKFDRNLIYINSLF